MDVPGASWYNQKIPPEPVSLKSKLSQVHTILLQELFQLQTNGKERI
jgi:hypothetical protein